MQTTERTTVEEVPETVGPEIDAGAEIEGVGRLRDRLDDIADGFDVRGFKCVKCGIVHNHDTTKHQLSETYDTGADLSAAMAYNQVCHCGLNEAARHGADFGIDEASAASRAGSAPIHDETARTLDEEFGAA